MQDLRWKDQNGELKKLVEMFNVPDGEDAAQTLARRHREAMEMIAKQNGELVSIKQAPIGRNDPCPCGSGMKFKRCCEKKLGTAR
jgi:uncharacterized protein YecA (UPF0149 family)